MSQPEAQAEAPNKAVLVVGNVIDGLTFYGPFDSFDDAMAFANDSLGPESWVVTDLIPPASFSDES